MKKFLTTLFIAAGCTLFGATPAELDKYLPLAQMIQAGNDAEGVAGLEAIGAKNPFAAVTLYLIYSRGYCGKSVEYQKAVTSYFDSLLGTPFHFDEHQLFWTKKRFQEENGLKFVVLRDEYGPHQYQLGGKYPLKLCYTEEMLQIGGVVPRALYEVARDRDGRTIRDKAMTLARAMGNPGALNWLADTNIAHDTPEYLAHIKRLEKAAELGHVPSMIKVAAFYQKNVSKVPTDHRKAGELLKKAEKKLLSYSAVGCNHTRLDLETTQKLLKSVPDYKMTTVQLLERMSKAYPDEILIDAIGQELAKRDDHPDCAFYRIQPKLKECNNSPEALAELRIVAEKGSHAAIWFLLQSPDTKDKYHFFYLAGKFGMKHYEFKTSEDLYKKALEELHQHRYTLPGNGYREELRLLAEVLPWAKEEYDRDFGREENIEKRFEIKIAHPDFASAQWIEIQGHKVLKITVKACDQPNYLDFFSAPNSKSGAGELFMHSQTSLSSQEVWGELVQADNSHSCFYVGNPLFGVRSKRFRINIAPTQKNFELFVNGL